MVMPKDQFVPEKTIWTQADFEKMGWHDVVVHAIAFDLDAHELLLDIDYILKWIEPEAPLPYYSFWLSPATLIFHGASNLEIGYKASLGFQLQGIVLHDSPPPAAKSSSSDKTQTRWELEGNEGSISLSSRGFTQYLRKIPIRNEAQFLGLAERGGISFDKPTAPRISRPSGRRKK